MARQDIKKTGWPEGLLQDDDKRLSRWFASRPDARYVLRKQLEKDRDEKMDQLRQGDHRDNHDVPRG
jgi:hypothetical protein